MSKKVTDNDIKKLIEEALKENIEITIPTLDYEAASIGGPDNEEEKKILDFFGAIPARSGKNGTGSYNTFSKKSSKHLYDMLKDIADDVPVDTILDSLDFESRIGLESDPDEDLKILNGLLRILKDPKRKTISSEKREEYSKLISTMVEEANTKIFSDLGQLKTILTKDKSEDHKWIRRALRSRKLISDQDKLDNINKMISDVVSDPNAEIPSDVRAELRDDILQMRTPILDPFGRVASPSNLGKQSGATTELDSFRARQVSSYADSNLLAKFKTIQGSSILEKLQSLSDFASKINQGEEGIKNWLNEGNNEFDLINYSSVLSLLGDLPAESQRMTAGEDFEVWLSLFFNMPIVGADKGLVDNVGKAVNGGLVYTSAKLYANACGASQSEDGFDNHFSDSSSATYFIFEKIGSSFGPTKSMERVNSMNVYLVNLEKKPDVTTEQKTGDKTGQDSNYVGRLLGMNGETLYGPYTLKYKNKTQIRIMPCAEGDNSENFSDFVFTKIPLNLPELINDPYLDSTAQYISKMIKNTDSEFAVISKKIIKAYETLQLIEQNTDNYTSSKSKNSSDNSKEYVEGIGNNFTIFKTTINSIFEEAGEGKDAMLSETNKVTTNFLKKLIEESFKK